MKSLGWSLSLTHVKGKEKFDQRIRDNRILFSDKIVSEIRAFHIQIARLAIENVLFLWNQKILGLLYNSL